MRMRIRHDSDHLVRQELHFLPELDDVLAAQTEFNEKSLDHSRCQLLYAIRYIT